MEGKFTEEDKQQVIDFLNLVASKAEFKFNTSEVIKYFKLLSFMQQTMLHKLEENILEVKKITEDSKEE